jgi:hypothetical protein
MSSLAGARGWKKCQNGPMRWEEKGTGGKKREEKGGEEEKGGKKRGHATLLV